uniref:NXPE C-terminal domain-containing protein n=1 Tax=Periophthalmus magnuspinnatus TaxID=409849 RepID=A0A3B4B441_9GOBI
MATLAYSLGKLEINQYFTIKNAKLISLFLALVLLLVHSFSGSDSCQRLLSTGRFLGNNVWQPEGCMMHTYTSREASTCLNGKKVIFIGDSRIRALFISFISIIASQKQSAIKVTKAARHVSLQHFVWSPWTNNSMKERLILVSKVTYVNFNQWIIRDFKGSAEGLHQYKVNLTSMSPALERLAEHGEVYWHIQAQCNEMHPYISVVPVCHDRLQR